MISLSPWIVPAAAPLLLLAVASLPQRWRAAPTRRMCDLALCAALLCLLSAIGFGVRAAHEPEALVLRWPAGRGLAPSLYIDALTAIMGGLVSFVGAVVLRYSRNYLDGDPGQGRFIRWLCLTLSAVLALIVSGNLLWTGVAWFAAGVGLRRLLTFKSGRPAAILAARKNLVFSRTADLCLLVATALIYKAVGSLDYGDVLARAAAWTAPGLPWPVSLACGLIAAAVLLKSAQLPVHGWLLEVMETPTPVSALLHAGVINAGGFLILRLSGLISQSAPALDALAMVGGATAVFGSLVMLAQTSVKVSLAYSTIAQIGFMMLECGLGAYAAALLHIVAHSLYKAHAFLSSGSVIDLARASWTPGPEDRPHPLRFMIALLGALAATWAVGGAFGATLTDNPGVLVLGTVLTLGLTQLLASAIDKRPSLYVVGRTVAVAAAVAVGYFALQGLSERLLASVLTHVSSTRGLLHSLIAALVIAAFAGLTLFQNVLVGQQTGGWWGGLYAHVSNGFYLNTVVNRWLLRVWPNPPKRLAPSATPFGG